MTQGVPGRLRPRIILTFRHYKGGRSSAVSTSRLYPRRNPWYSFSGAESTPGHMVLSEGTTEKIPSDTTGNRSRDRPTSSATPYHYATPGPWTHVLVEKSLRNISSRREDNIKFITVKNDENLSRARLVQGRFQSRGSGKGNVRKLWVLGKKAMSRPTVYLSTCQRTLGAVGDWDPW